MNTTADRDPLDVIAEEFAERCRRGQMPSVAEYAASHPELAEELRELLPAVAQMEMLKRHRNSSLPTVEPLPENLRSIGDYRIVRELGRGGMGVVYEAVQESLGRRVALKVLPPGARKDATRRERFVRESHTAARLHHTNIVPVFGVGEEKGIPYFVMQYIPGCGLNEVIASWPREMRAESVQDTTSSSIPYHPYSSVDSSIIRRGDWNRIARLGIAAASALHYAHEQGVLHRDMKPGNLLLDHHGQLWVADFGLAKMVDHQTLTETGDLLGTVAYMAPEALQGEFTRQSDIYGLGMTLYELATGRLPFNETTPGPLIRAIGQSDAPPPRKWNPMIPRDLETIVMKAIAREPKRRYTTAEEFADDLRAFVQNRPILARRTSSLGRAILWAKRNPVVAGLSALTALAFLFAFVMGYLSYRGAQFALAQEIKLRKEAEQANEKLEKNLAMSLEAFEDIFDSIGDITPGPPGGRRPDPNGPRPEGMRPGGPNPGGFGGPPSGDPLAVLESILKFFDKFAEQNPTNPKLQLDAAKAYRRVGQIKLRFQQFRDDSVEKGEAALKRSLSILEQLRVTAPDTSSLNTEYLLTVAALPPTVERLPLFRDAIRQCEAEGNAERILRDLYERAIPAARKAGDTEFVKQTEPKLMELNNRLPPRPGNFGERGGERGFRGEGGDRPPGRQRD